MARLEELRKKYREQANFLIVYIKEAHPEDEWQMESNLKQGVVFKQPKTMGERVEMVRTFVSKMEVETPTLIDDISNPANACYAAWPERIYIIDTSGTIVYKSAVGPRGFRLDEAEQALLQHLGLSGDASD